MADETGGRNRMGILTLPFAALLAGLVLFVLGERLGNIAMIELLSTETERFAELGSTFELSKLALAMTLPALLLWPLAGPFIDRRSRKTVLVVTDLIRALGVLAIPFMWPGLPLWTVYGMIALLACAGVLFLPARCAVVSEMIPRHRLIKANSLLSIGATIAAVAGFGLGGLIADRVGWRTALYLDSGLYFLSAAALTMIKTKFPAAEGAGAAGCGYGGIIKEAFGALRSGRGARIGVAGPPFVVMAGTAACVLGVAAIERMSPRGTTYIGVLIGLAALGMAAGCYLTGRVFHNVERPRLVVFGTILAVTPLMVLGLTDNLVIIGIGAVLAGLGAGPVLVSSETAVQEDVPKLRQATVFAFRDVAMKAALVAAAVAAPAVASLTGLRAAIVLLLAACLALGLPIMTRRS